MSASRELVRFVYTGVDGTFVLRRAKVLVSNHLLVYRRNWLSGERKCRLFLFAVRTITWRWLIGDQVLSDLSTPLGLRPIWKADFLYVTTFGLVLA